MPDDPALGRRTILKTLGAFAVVPLVDRLDAARAWPVGEHHPLVPRQEADGWRPRFLTSHEDETVVALSERIIPATDTPGAAGARVNQYIDWTLSEAPADEQQAFRDGLAWIDANAAERHGRAFVDLDARQQDALLTPLADAADRGVTTDTGAAFFANVKRRTIEGYYRSEVGMRLELGYGGNAFLARFEGCAHREHLDWTPGPERA